MNFVVGDEVVLVKNYRIFKAGTCGLIISIMPLADKSPEGVTTSTHWIRTAQRAHYGASTGAPDEYYRLVRDRPQLPDPEFSLEEITGVCL